MPPDGEDKTDLEEVVRSTPMSGRAVCLVLSHLVSAPALFLPLPPFCPCLLSALASFLPLYYSYISFSRQFFNVMI